MPDGRRTTKTFRRKYDADIFKRQLEDEKNRFRLTGITINCNITFKDYAIEWFNQVIKGRKAKKTESAYWGDMHKHLFPTLGPILLKDISIKQSRDIESKLIGD